MGEKFPGNDTRASAKLVERRALRASGHTRGEETRSAEDKKTEPSKIKKYNFFFWAGRPVRTAGPAVPPRAPGRPAAIASERPAVDRASTGPQDDGHGQLRSRSLKFVVGARPGDDGHRARGGRAPWSRAGTARGPRRRSASSTSTSSSSRASNAGPSGARAPRGGPPAAAHDPRPAVDYGSTKYMHSIWESIQHHLPCKIYCVTRYFRTHQLAVACSRST